jgi:hypothetical protein
MKDSRINEWYVPKFGPLKFRLFIGLLFLPYTGMCISFVILGSLLSPNIDAKRLFAICLIYFMSLGVAAHIADSMGSKRIKPWGDLFTRKQNWILMISCLSFSYVLGFYYIIYFTPLLLIIAVLEGFFLFAYNFEIFNGFFHTDSWFSISWGILPFLGGFIIQTNSITLLSFSLSFIALALSYIEIKISRPYKNFRRNQFDLDKARSYEIYLKILSLGTISVTLVLLLLKMYLSN